MTIVLDFPDSPNRNAIPYPMTFENGVGSLVVIVEEREGKLVMTYTVSRDSVDDRYDYMMDKLESAAKEITRLFNREAV